MQKGFTLIECLITLIVFAILAAFSFPSMRELLQRNQDELLQQNIVQLIQFSQDQAMAHSQPVGLKLNTKNEMIIFSNNHNLMVHQLNLAQGELRIRSYPYYRDYLRFSAGSNDNGTITYLKKNKIMWAIVLSQTGRVKIMSAI